MSRGFVMNFEHENMKNQRLSPEKQVEHYVHIQSGVMAYS